MNQPPQKAYKDWNTSWPENSWEITEPAIYYQGAYVYLLSRFVRPLTYQDWVTGYGLSGGAANPFSDADGDGVKNLMEYAFDLSPLVADQASLPQFTVQRHPFGGGQQRFLTIQFPRQLGATNLTYTVQGSSNLVHWTAVCTVSGTNTPVGPGFVSQSGTDYLRQVTARDIVPIESGASMRYIRFVLTLN